MNEQQEATHPEAQDADYWWRKYIDLSYDICRIFGLHFEFSSHDDQIETLELAREMLKDNHEFQGRLLAIKWRNVTGGVPSLEEVEREGDSID